MIKDNEIDKSMQPQKESKANLLTTIKAKLNRWTIFIGISLLAIFVILYVSNVIYINHLMKDCIDLKKKADNARNVNSALQMKYNNLQAPERIVKIATEELGLVPGNEAPMLIVVPENE